MQEVSLWVRFTHKSEEVRHTSEHCVVHRRMQGNACQWESSILDTLLTLYWRTLSGPNVTIRRSIAVKAVPLYSERNSQVWIFLTSRGIKLMHDQ